MTAAPIVAVSGVTRTFADGRVAAVREVTLAVRPGDYVALSGPSGCGKTTLLHLLAGIERPTSGQVVFEGRRMTAGAAWTRHRARRIGVVFQAFYLMPTLTAIENVELPMFGVIRDRRARERRAADLIDRVGLADRRHQRPAMLSGGEQQRVAIARSLANRPGLLLADEPTGNLDSESATGVMTLLESCCAGDGLALVVATHDATLAARARRRIVMKDGRIVSELP